MIIMSDIIFFAILAIMWLIVRWRDKTYGRKAYAVSRTSPKIKTTLVSLTIFCILTPACITISLMLVRNGITNGITGLIIAIVTCAIVFNATRTMKRINKLDGVDDDTDIVLCK